MLGQLWYDTTYRKLKVYNGIFLPVGGAVISRHQPSGQEPGEFWLDTSTNVLNFLDEDGQYQSITSFPRSDVSGWKYPTHPIYNNNTASFAQQVTLLQSYGDILGALSADAFTASEYDSTSTFSKANTTTFDIAAGLTIIGDIRTTGALVSDNLVSYTGNITLDASGNIYTFASDGFIQFPDTSRLNVPSGGTTATFQALNSYAIQTAKFGPTWTFDTNGVLTIPGSIFSPGDFIIESNANGYNSGLYFNANTATGSTTILYGTQDVTIRASNNDLPLRDWIFGADSKLTLPNGAVINSSAVSTSSVTYYNYDAASLTIGVTPSTTIDFPNFSGQILINDHFDGQVELWLAGGAYAYRLGTSKSGSAPQTLGNIAFNPGIHGYTWTSAVTGTMVFVATRTRLEA
jgi:hypothetical protein